MTRAWLYLLPLSALGCGGKAVIDRDGAGGATSTTTSPASSPATTTGSGMGVCQSCLGAEIRATGALVNAELTEASGLAASRLHDGVFYVHNDSGGAPQFFAIDATGADLGTYVVNEAAAIDWEDAASGPCDASGGESCIYLGDIGDNAETRGSYALYRVREPASITPGGHNINADTITFKYEDGSHNAEALIVDPKTADVYIVTKSKLSAPAIYRLVAPLASGAVATKVGEVEADAMSLVTGGSAHESGVLLRTYSSVLLFTEGADVLSRLTGSACAVASPAELQGEAIEWQRDGLGYLTVAEGDFATVYQMRCAP